MATKKVNGKNKGARAERVIAKLFEKWTGYEFTRVPSSGGLRWHRKNDTVGDLICSDDTHSRYFTFSVECKSYQDINFQHLLLDVKPKILGFWKQACDDALRSNKIPLLLMRQNGMPRLLYYVVVGYDYYTEVLGLIPNSLINPKNEIAIFPSTELWALDYKSLHKNNKLWKKSGQ